MVKMSRYNVFYDLSISPYMKELDEILFVFSSKWHKDKFTKQYKDFVLQQNSRFKEKYLIDLNFEKLFLLQLYQRIESRGFFIKINGVEYTCPKSVKLNGVITI